MGIWAASLGRKKGRTFTSTSGSYNSAVRCLTLAHECKMTKIRRDQASAERMQCASNSPMTRSTDPPHIGATVWQIALTHVSYSLSAGKFIQFSLAAPCTTFIFHHRRTVPFFDPYGHGGRAMHSSYSVLTQFMTKARSIICQQMPTAADAIFSTFYVWDGTRSAPTSTHEPPRCHTFQN
jgi:hypothetical protein